MSIFFQDLTGLPKPLSVVAALRASIVSSTGCTVSAGVGPNMLLARLATGRAKPNGVFSLLDPADVAPFLAPLPVKSLPGVGVSGGGV